MNLLKAAFGTSAMIFLSRITGLFREILFNSTFGVSALTDAFNVAFRIPNMLRRMFAEGAFSQAFVPILGEQKTKYGDEATRLFVSQVASLLAAVLLVVTVIGVVAAPLLIYAMGSGLAKSPDTFQLATQLLRIMFPYIIFISLVSLATGVLNTYGRFKVAAVTPVILNITALAVLIGLHKRATEAQLINALAWSVFAGGVLQLSLLIYALHRINMTPRFAWAPAASGVKRLLTLMIPAVLGVSVSQVSLMINTQYATHIGEGAVSWLASADRLMEFPSALLGVALGAVILPNLVRHKVAGNNDGFSKLVDWGLRLTVALAAPATIALAALSVPVIATIFWHGKFTRVDVMQTQVALLGYCVGLIGIIAVKILAPSFYAKQDIKTPLKVGIVILILTQVGNFILVPLLKHAALSLTISIGALLNATILYVLLRRAGLYKPEPGWILFLLKISLACSAMLAVLLWLTGDHASWFQLNMWQRMGRLAMLICAGAGIYFASLWVTGIRPHHFKQIGST